MAGRGINKDEEANMLGKISKQKDFFDSYVYENLLPGEHILLDIKEQIDFSFVEEETKDLYDHQLGRPSYPPEVLLKMLFLEFYYNLSDVEVAQQCKYNILYRYFFDGKESPYRKRVLKLRKMIERKFGEAKKWHGLTRARYRSKWKVAVQVLMTFLVMNAKRIVRLLKLLPKSEAFQSALAIRAG